MRERTTAVWRSFNGLAGHDLGAIHHGVDLEAEARLDDPVELLALVAHDGIRGERGEPAADREQRGHATRPRPAG